MIYFALVAGLLAGTNAVHEVCDRSTDPEYAADVNDSQVDFIVTNTTQYKAWDTSWNWVKSEAAAATGDLKRGGDFLDTNLGIFLVGTHLADQPVTTSGWSQAFTACEFKYQFVTSDLDKRQPITLPRTDISFYVSSLRPADQAALTPRPSCDADHQMPFAAGDTGPP